MFEGMNVEHALHCQGDLRFDALLGDELTETDRRTLLEHVARCPRCRDRLAAITCERARFLASELAMPPWLATAANPAQSARVPWWSVGAGLLLAACALLIGLPRDTPTERAKGGEQLSFFVKRGDRVQRGSVTEPLHPGDRLRFAYTSARARYVAIASVDAAKQTSVYFPSGARAERLEAGREVPLPSAIELDDTLGDERIFALFCDAPIELAPVRAALEANEQAPRLPSGCVTDVLMLHKESPPR
jgi:anti-sigma factor RsiW